MATAHVSEVRAQHFRSFGDDTVVRLKPGLNLVVGPNGSGKSNILDAMLFALTQDASTMRARAWGELANRARRGPCAVSVRIVDAANDGALDVFAFVKDENGRGLRLGGKAATVAQVRAALLGVGIDAETPSFAIRQHEASQPMEPRRLAALLLLASGGVRFNAAVAASTSALAKERGVLEAMLGTLAQLAALSAEAQRQDDALRRLRALRRKIGAAERARRDAAGRAAAIVETRRTRECESLQRRAADAQAAGAALATALAGLTAELAAAREAAHKRGAAAAAAQRRLDDAAARAADCETALVDASVREAREAAPPRGGSGGEGGGGEEERAARALAAEEELRRLQGRLHAAAAEAAEGGDGDGGGGAARAVAAEAAARCETTRGRHAAAAAAAEREAAAAAHAHARSPAEATAAELAGRAASLVEPRRRCAPTTRAPSARRRRHASASCRCSSSRSPTTHGMMKIPAAELRDAAELLGSVVNGLRQADPHRPIRPNEWLRLLSSVEEERFIASSLLATAARRSFNNGN